MEEHHMKELMDTEEITDLCTRLEQSELVTAELLAALKSVLPNTPGWNTKDFAGRAWLSAAQEAISKAENLNAR